MFMYRVSYSLGFRVNHKLITYRMDCIYEPSGSSLGSWSGVVGKVAGRPYSSTLFSRAAFCCRVGAPVAVSDSLSSPLL